MIKFYLTQEEFNALFAKTRITSKYRDALKTVLVDKIELKTVATQTGLNKQSISRGVTALRNKYHRLMDVPADWLTSTVSLPPKHSSVFQSIKQLEKESLLELREKVSDPKLS